MQREEGSFWLGLVKKKIMKRLLVIYRHVNGESSRKISLIILITLLFSVSSPPHGYRMQHLSLTPNDVLDDCSILLKDYIDRRQDITQLAYFECLTKNQNDIGKLLQNRYR